MGNKLIEQVAVGGLAAWRNPSFLVLSRFVLLWRETPRIRGKYGEGEAARQLQTGSAMEPRTIHLDDIIMIDSSEDIMPIIKPISDLRNKSLEISNLAHKTREPIFITRNGEGDLVVLSMEAYDRIQRRLDLYVKLGEAESEVAAGEKGVPASEAMKALRRRMRARG
jgi:prevent-host-death family protein